jgi:hypothetical protein
MSKTFYKTIEGKKNYKKSNAVVFKGFLSRFSAFLCMASPKTPRKYFHIGLEKSHKSQKKSTYLPTSQVQVLEVEVLVAGASGARKRKTRVPASLKKGHCRAAFSARFLTGK